MPKTYNMPESTSIEEYVRQSHIKVGDLIWTNILGNPLHAEKYMVILQDHLKYPVKIQTDFDLIK